MQLTRRDFLRTGTLLGAASFVPGGFRRIGAEALPAPADLTTLNSTVVKGALLSSGTRGNYHRLTTGPGEQHLVRGELASRTATTTGASLVNFVHITDVHLIDAQSPARVEWLDRYNDLSCSSLLFASAFRPQEALTLQVFEAMIRQIRAVGVSPITGVPLGFAISTGDNIDNEQYNELRWFIDMLDGGVRVAGNSGSKDVFEGVQSLSWGDAEYWHPDGGITDKYKIQWGFPDYPGLLDEAIRPFQATGIGMPWYQTFGNHDGLVQGNFPRTKTFDTIATGPLKVSGAPHGTNPCDPISSLLANPEALLAAPTRPVTPDADRRIASRSQYVEEMFKTTGTPIGHGFTDANRTTGVAYWQKDEGLFRMIGLDTVNPGGHSDGSIGVAQLAWLEARLKEVSSRYYDASGNEVSTGGTNKLVILFSHHGLRSIKNPFNSPDPFDSANNDYPRRSASDIEKLVQRFPNVIAWVNGHSHKNIVEPRRAVGRNHGFWDIGTAAHIDFGCQSRLIEVTNNKDGTLSIFCTMIDHAAPVTPSGADPVMRLASISRELAANDYQEDIVGGRGRVEDRNVELVVKSPFPIA